MTLTLLTPSRRGAKGVVDNHYAHLRMEELKPCGNRGAMDHPSGDVPPPGPGGTDSPYGTWLGRLRPDGLPKVQPENGVGNKSAEARPIDYGATVVLGIIFGAILGLILDEIGLGMAVGLVLATAVNAYNEKKRNIKNAEKALVISIGSVIVVILIWGAQAVGWF